MNAHHRIAPDDRFLIATLAAVFALVAYGIFTHRPRPVAPGDDEYVEYIENHVAVCFRAGVAENRKPSNPVRRPDLGDIEATCRLIVTEFDRNHPESRPHR